MSEQEKSAVTSTNAGIYRPGGTVITLPDPDQLSTSHDQKGTIQWRTGSHKYPNFEVQFFGPNPQDGVGDKNIKGSDTEPVVIKLNYPGEYKYKIFQLNEKKDKKSMKDLGVTTFRVQSCGDCYP